LLFNGVFVTNISPDASQQTIADFFTFCGPIKSISLNIFPNRSGQATVVFETEEGAKTALLLTNALLADRPITVVPYKAEEHQSQQNSSTDREVPKENLTTEEKSQGVIAPILAAGYEIGNNAITKIKEIDEKNNISKNLINATDATLNKVIELDKTLQVSSTVGNLSKKVDQSLNISQNYNSAIESMTNSIDSGYVKVREAPVVQTAVHNISEFGQSVSNFFAPPADAIKNEVNQVQTQTREIIEKKEAAKKKFHQKIKKKVVILTNHHQNDQMKDLM